MAVANTLRKGTKCKGIVTIPFRHEIYNYFFSSKKELYKDDFDTKYFPGGWDQVYRKCDEILEGVIVDFSIYAWKKIQWTHATDYYVDINDVMKKKRTFRETLKLEIVKVNTSLNVTTN